MRSPRITLLSIALLTPTSAFAQTATTKPAPDQKVNPAPTMAHKMPQIKMTGVQLDQAIDFVRDASGLNINVNWHALELLNVTKETPISLRLTDVPTRRVIRAILDQTPAAGALTFYVEDGIVEITTKELADQEMITRVYPVDDLLMLVPDFKGPQVDITQQTNNQTSGQGGGGGGSSTSLFGSNTNAAQQDTPLGKQQRADDLVKMLKSTIRPEIWRENGGPASMAYFNGHLVVTAPRSVHEALGH